MKNLFFISLSFLMACSINTSREIEKEKLTFNYRDDAYIFFRNMRQARYNLEVMEEAGWRIYRHEDFEKDTSEYFFTTALVVNWQASKAYAIMELPGQISKEGLKVFWKGEETNEQGEISLSGLSRQAELAFLTDIYNHIVKDHLLYWNQERKESVALFKNNDQKEAFRVSMYDFYRLTGLL
ncbi:hypothetical protein JKA74_10590 [Marivirga sp. S37H4]|uniref:Lipoprotein n=1 Tax=Marivirga aurantiaca TaxID=2802615 RepID=A0A934WZ45_9BACT|nr:hypothetical protein [Marivirga aurantiaca]MBK6265485.1 hypothetical protein [Marivirga aurantiaca]